MHAGDEHVGRWMHSTRWRKPLVEIEIDPSEELAGIKVKVAMRRSSIDRGDVFTMTATLYIYRVA